MNSVTRARLHDLTLEARRILMEDARGLLEGVYGLRGSGRFDPVERLPAVQGMPEVAETRARLEGFLSDEMAAGMSAREAVDKLVKEVAFTHLNRLVAFKMLEARRLIYGTLDRYHSANGFLRYLADPAQADDYARYQAGDLPQDLRGEGPRDVAYRHFLLWQAGRLAQEIRVLFDPDNLPSRLFPRPRALRDVISLLNSPEVAEAWAPGNEETIGWVYQYFNEEEKAEVFERLYKKKQKIGRQDVPAATQLFTPRWIVEFLVQNTLGRTWLQMHPKSRLVERMPYLIPPAGDIPHEPLKPAREITVLDPACGTMHFGLVAFDLLAEMYREELEHSGQPGWPREPSVASEADIPAAIVANNLYGIDIDLRAVQLSALTLYLKAKSLNRDAALTRTNLVPADVLPFRQHDLDVFLAEMRFTRPVYERILRALWPKLGEVADLGSLARLEREVTAVIEQERARRAKEERENPLLVEVMGDHGPAVAAEDQWRAIEDHIVWALDHYAKTAPARGHDVTFFVGEATKGLRLLDVMRRRYDVVLSNPPYMARRNMNEALARHLTQGYPAAKGDLYTAFIQRCAEWLSHAGRLGMITQQSFMFISSYEGLRQGLLDDTAIETMCHVGPRAFEEIGGEKVNTTLFVLRREPVSSRRHESMGTYFRLVREPDAAAKRLGFERALARLRAGQRDPAVFRYRQGDFDAIPGAPWVYWITPGLRRLFVELPKLGDIAPPRQGLATADNFRFLRYWWEAGFDRVAFGCANADQAQASGKRWFPAMKGGSFRRWWGNQEYVINWAEEGAEIKEHICFAYPYLNGKWGWVAKNTEHCFRRGVTYSALTSATFTARLMPAGFIFTHKGPAVLSSDGHLLLAIFNSEFARYGLRLINPNVSFEVGNLARLPISTRASDTIHALVEQAIELAKTESAEDETTYDFVAPPSWRTGIEDVRRRRQELAEVERRIDEEVYRLYGISAEDRAAIEAELAEPAAETADDETPEDPKAEEEVGSGGPTRQELARRWISYAVGVVLGRFSPGEEGALGRGCFPPGVAASPREMVDPDGVVTLDPGHPDDLAAKVQRALELIWGEEDTARIVEAAGGSRHQLQASLRGYLERDFFRWHVPLYRKRPVYWLLQSPKRSYGFYLFHERITPDTLYLLQGSRYLEGRINRARAESDELRRRLEAAPPGAERRRLARALDAQEGLLRDLEAFARNLALVTSQTSSRGEVVGWKPELDDGVLLNLAPLHSLIPAWSAEPKKAWEALARGDYDWSRTAMRYWPDRVLEACKRNKSYAIAHDRRDLYAEAK